MNCLTKHPVEMRLSCATGSHSSDEWRLVITDSISGDRIVEVALPYHAIADLISTRSTRGGYLNFWNPDSVLTSREQKTVKIEVPNGLYKDKALTDPSIVEQLAAIEVDGWNAYRNDITNHHQCIGYCGESKTHTQTVHCSRRVPLTADALRKRVATYNEYRTEEDQVPAEQVEKWCAELESLLAGRAA